MWMVTPGNVGREAYDRMLRDRVIVPLLPEAALPRDIEPTPAIRRHVLTAALPAGVRVTALAALWVHGHAPWPGLVDVRCDRRTIPRTRELALDVVVHAEGRGGSAGVADARTATVDALRWSAHAWAVPAALCAHDAGAFTRADLDAWALASAPTAALARGVATVAAALDRRALGLPAPPWPAPASQGRLVPVTRLAS